MTSTTFRVSGKLRLTKPGTDRILDPDKFTFTLRASLEGKAVLAVLSCTIDKSPAPVGLTVKVTGLAMLLAGGDSCSSPGAERGQLRYSVFIPNSLFLGGKSGGQRNH